MDSCSQGERHKLSVSLCSRHTDVSDWFGDVPSPVSEFLSLTLHLSVQQCIHFTSIERRVRGKREENGKGRESGHLASFFLSLSLTSYRHVQRERQTERGGERERGRGRERGVKAS